MKTTFTKYIIGNEATSKFWVRSSFYGQGARGPVYYADFSEDLSDAHLMILSEAKKTLQGLITHDYVAPDPLTLNLQVIPIKITFEIKK